jgi:hypothetical protein
VLQLQQQIENSLAKQVGSQGPFWEAAGETVINLNYRLAETRMSRSGCPGRMTAKGQILPFDCGRAAQCRGAAASSRLPCVRTRR